MHIATFHHFSVIIMMFFEGIEHKKCLSGIFGRVCVYDEVNSFHYL